PPLQSILFPYTTLFRSNYGTGNFPAYRILADGSIGPMTALFQSVGNGTGPQPDRQEGPHAHQILTDLGGGHVFGVDLGGDKVNRSEEHTSELQSPDHLV